MKKLGMILAASLVMLSTACKEDKKMNSEMDDTPATTIEKETPATAIKKSIVGMSAKNDSGVSGEIAFIDNGEKVKMEVKLSGLTEGEHAIHIHQNGDCSSDDGKSAGGHWAGMNAIHGQWGHGDYHSGDIGNLVADANGNATLAFYTDKWCLGCGDETKDLMNHSVIVHASADDFKSQPSGAAGARVACGVIQ